MNVDAFGSRNAQHPDSLLTKLPDWADRIPRIRAALSEITTPFINRRQLAELFGVSSSQAGRLIRNMRPMLHGNSLVVDAEDIRKMLSDIERDREIRDLRRRLAEKDVEIDQVRRKSESR